MSAEQFKQFVTRKLYRNVDGKQNRAELYKLMMYCYREGVKAGSVQNER